MNRILLTLSTLSLTVMAAALLLGLGVGDLYDGPSESELRWATVHRLTGTAAALAVVLVESIVVTYFIGTSRWCREVAETYRLHPELPEQSQQLKRRAFPWAVAGMVTVVVVGALGAAGDPANGSGQAATEPWSQVHLIAAFAGLAIVGWTYWITWQYVCANQAVIDSILSEVARIRGEREQGHDTASSLHAPQPAALGARPS